MGLDLVVEGCAKPGHEQEWRELLERSFADKQLSDAEVTRFQEISIPGYQRIGAPRVGLDPAANEWILQARMATTPEEIAAVLKEFHGYYTVRVVNCDGVPKYSNAGLYEGADDTSFRGAFLNDCRDVLTRGRSLLTAADAAESEGRSEKRRRGIFSFLGLSKEREPMPIADQTDIVRAAGRWFIFWGERGHPIRAWF